jgi:hypothetical protein
MARLSVVALLLLLAGRLTRIWAAPTMRRVMTSGFGCCWVRSIPNRSRERLRSLRQNLRESVEVCSSSHCFQLHFQRRIDSSPMAVSLFNPASTGDPIRIDWLHPKEFVKQKGAATDIVIGNNKMRRSLFERLFAAGIFEQGGKNPSGR